LLILCYYTINYSDYLLLLPINFSSFKCRNIVQLSQSNSMLYIVSSRYVYYVFNTSAHIIRLATNGVEPPRYLIVFYTFSILKFFYSAIRVRSKPLICKHFHFYWRWTRKKIDTLNKIFWFRVILVNVKIYHHLIKSNSRFRTCAHIASSNQWDLVFDETYYCLLITALGGWKHFNFLHFV